MRDLLAEVIGIVHEEVSRITPLRLCLCLGLPVRAAAYTCRKQTRIYCAETFECGATEGFG